MNRSMPCIMAFFLIILFTHASAWAYLDPGTGSYIFQLLLAAVVGGIYLIKVYWMRIRTFLGHVFHKTPRDDKGNE